MTDSCSVEGCARPVLARGWCSAHWQRWRRNGDPIAGKPVRIFNLPVAERLAAASERAPNGCLIWKGSTDRFGHGEIHVDSGSRGTHIVAWELANGPVPKGKELHHTCQTPACIEVRHLVPLTRGEHMRAHAALRTHHRCGHVRTREPRCLICRRARDARKRASESV